MSTYLKVIKQTYHRGVNFNYVQIIVYYEHCLETLFDV